jgi:hypothetical protein
MHPGLIRRLWILASIAGLSAANVSAQSTPPTSAATRLKLIAEEAPPTSEPPAAAGLTDVVPRSRPPAMPATDDPTAPGPEMRRLIGDDSSNNQNATSAYPDFRLRARVIVHGKPPVALIEDLGSPARATVAGPPGTAGGPPSPHSVPVLRAIREGDEFVLPQGETTSPIRVVKLTASEVVLELVNRKIQIRLD